MPALRSVLSLLLIATAAAHAAETPTPDRRPPKHGLHTSKSPGWCLLVFGADAKTRMWVAVDGNVLHVDRNANGDLTDDKPVLRPDGGRVFELGPITDPATKTTYPHLRLTTISRTGGLDHFELNVLVPDRYEQYVGPTPVGDTPESAPVLQLDGPLTVGLFVRRPRHDLVVPTDLRDASLFREGRNRLIVFVGTMNHGKNVMPTCVMSCSEGALPKSVSLPPTFHPTAEITFEPRDPKAPAPTVTLRIDDD